MRGDPERQRLFATHRVRRSLAFASLAALVVLATGAAASSPDTTWTLAGTGVAADSGDGGHAREAAINQPRSISAIPGGGFVWAEPYSNRVRIVDANGIVKTLAGTGVAGSAGDGGLATAAQLDFVHSAVPTADGGFLLADTQNDRIRKVSSSGIITTVAGNGQTSFGGDGGPATSAQINHPRSLVVLPDGGFLIPDTNNHRVRRVSASGIITTVAGTGVQGFSGDGGQATSAQLSMPFAVAPTADGGFLVIDVGNQRIRKVWANGMIDTVAGDGTAGFSGDGGSATDAKLRDPHALVALADGGFLVADTSNERIRRVDSNGTITTVVGDGVRGDNGDGGTAALARVAAPKGVSLTGAGDLLIADEQNNRIRFVGTVVASSNTSAPAISGDAVQGQQLTATAGGWSGTVPVVSYQWQRCNSACASISGVVAKTYSLTSADAGATLRVAVSATNPAGTTTAFSAETAAVNIVSPPPPPTTTTTTTTTTTAAPPASPPPAAVTPLPAPVVTPAPTPTAAPTWVVRVTASSQRAAEYTARAGNTRLSDAIDAYGTPSCKAVGARQVIATWESRGIRIDGRTARALPRSKTGCSAPQLISVSEIRLTDRRWTTSLGLHVGDTVSKLRKLYGRVLSARATRASTPNEYYLVWRHGKCVGSCTTTAKRNGVDYPRLTAQIKNGQVVAFRLPVLAQG